MRGWLVVAAADAGRGHVEMDDAVEGRESSALVEEKRKTRKEMRKAKQRINAYCT